VSKQGGLGACLYVGGNDISGDIQSAALSGGPALLDVTDITQSAHSRLGGERDGTISLVSYWDPALAHPVLSALPTTDTLVTYGTGTAVGSPAACLNGLQINYDPTRGTDGSFTFAVEAQADGFGLEWGVFLTAGMRTSGPLTGGNSDTTVSLDTGGSLSFGAQMYIHVAAFSGTDATIFIRDSADNSTFANVTGLTGTAITSGAPLFQRVAISNTATVRRYVTARVATTSGLTSIQWAVILVKNPVAGVVF